MPADPYVINVDPRLLSARELMKQALALLDEASSSHAAALLDQAIHALGDLEHIEVFSLVAKAFMFGI